MPLASGEVCLGRRRDWCHCCPAVARRAVRRSAACCLDAGCPVVRRSLAGLSGGRSPGCPAVARLLSGCRLPCCPTVARRAVRRSLACCLDSGRPVVRLSLAALSGGRSPVVWIPVALLSDCRSPGCPAVGRLLSGCRLPCCPAAVRRAVARYAHRLGDNHAHLVRTSNGWLRLMATRLLARQVPHWWCRHTVLLLSASARNQNAAGPSLYQASGASGSGGTLMAHFPCRSRCPRWAGRSAVTCTLACPSQADTTLSGTAAAISQWRAALCRRL